MKVLIVVEPGIDGAFRHVEGLCRYLLGQGVTVHLAYSSQRGSDGLDELVRTIAANGGQTLDLRVGNAPKPNDVRAFRELRRFARSVCPDVIHAHSSKAGVLVRGMALSGIRARYFYTAHAYYGMGGTRSATRLAFDAIETVLGRVGSTINISPDEAEFARRTLRVPQRRISVIHNPVDTTIFRPPRGDERGSIRARFGIPDTALVLGSVGRLSFQKDPVTMHRAVAEVMADNPNLWFCRVGRGEMDAELDVLADDLGISPRMVSIAYLESPAEIYRAFDAFISTSRYEAGWPFVVLEAMASELPVIVTGARGTSDIGARGLSHCWMADTGDVGGFADAIRSWVDDTENRRPINHRSIVEDRFGVDALFGAVLRLYAD